MSCILQNSTKLNLPDSLAVVCNDAGASNLIIAWLRGQTANIRYCLAGPAFALWQKESQSIKNLPLKDALQDVSFLLSGTGWASNIEHDSRKLARDLGVRSVAVLDHWTNYRERFLREGEIVLPDELWVADDYAEIAAKVCFPGIPIVQYPNCYLVALVREVANLNPKPARQYPHNILYALEPIRQDWGHDDRACELQAFEYFLKYLSEIGPKHDFRIVLRPHPTDHPGKYNQWLNHFPDFDLHLDAKTSLPEQIAWADWVVGCETFVLVIALSAGRVAVSSSPPWAPDCRLPQRELRHLRDMTGISS